MTRATHFLGTIFASRAACGRMILAYQTDAPAHTADRTKVTCRACRSVLAR